MPDYRTERPDSPDDVISAAVDQIAAAYAEASETGRAKQILDAATPGQRLMCAWYFYWDDVTNGGHAQYFANYTGDLWEEALKATDALGVPEAAILRDAVALFPNGRPAATDVERQEQLETIDERKLDALDKRFYDAPSSDQEVRRYIEAHAEEFFVDGGGGA